MQFATNYLGHFALTLALRRHLAKANGARVVSVASTGNLFARPLFWTIRTFPLHSIRSAACLWQS